MEPFVTVTFLDGAEGSGRYPFYVLFWLVMRNLQARRLILVYMQLTRNKGERQIETYHGASTTLAFADTFEFGNLYRELELATMAIAFILLEFVGGMVFLYV